MGCFGEDALDRFCRSGRIDDVTMDKIRNCEGPIASSGANEDDDEVE